MIFLGNISVLAEADGDVLLLWFIQRSHVVFEIRQEMLCPLIGD